MRLLRVVRKRIRDGWPSGRHFDFSDLNFLAAPIGKIKVGDDVAVRVHLFMLFRIEKVRAPLQEKSVSSSLAQ